MNLTGEPEATTCQICLDPILKEEAVGFCPAPNCRAPYHQKCWEWLEGCAVYGCPNMVEVKKPENEASTYWGLTEKTCPMCAETIPIGALECPYCRSIFDDLRPMTREDLLPKSEDPALASYRKAATWFFVFSLLGCTSPLALLIGGPWYWSHRHEIAKAGATAKALCVIGLCICLLYLAAVSLGMLIWNLRAAATPAGGSTIDKQAIQNSPVPVNIPSKHSSLEIQNESVARSDASPHNPAANASPVVGETSRMPDTPDSNRRIKSHRASRETRGPNPPSTPPLSIGTPPTFPVRVTWQELEAVKHLRRAEQFYRQEQFVAALEECEKGLKLNPGDDALRKLKKEITRQRRP